HYTSHVSHTTLSLHDALPISAYCHIIGIKIAYNTIDGSDNHAGGLSIPIPIKILLIIPLDGLYILIHNCAIATEDKSIGNKYIFLKRFEPLIFDAKINATANKASKLIAETNDIRYDSLALSLNF